MEHETITACENICRDFSWLGSFSDWLPVFAAAIASVTALHIAYRAYPKQKRKDQELEMENELRASYREFVDEIFAVHRELLGLSRNDSFDSTNFPKELGRLLRRSDAALMRLGLEAKNDVIVEASQSVEQLYSVNRALGHGLKKLSEAAKGNSIFDEHETLRVLVEDTINAYRDDLAQSLERVVNAMRRDGFGRSDELRVSTRSALDDFPLIG